MSLAGFQKELVGETSYKEEKVLLRFPSTAVLRKEGRVEDTDVWACALCLEALSHGHRRWKTEESSEGVLYSWWSSQPVGQPLLGAGRSWGRAVRPQGSGLISDITDLGPGRKCVEVKEAYSPRIDGHHHCHQATDVDPQTSFHLQGTSSRAHSPRSL